MAVEMGMFLQFRVAVAGEHLSVSINVNSFSGCLLKKVIEIFEVMSGNEDCFSLLCP
ncbi:MAG: hypothetical protein A4E66_02359 [Syntrophus sp. PtaB.Bin001]|nr:MAG: hypothetical protein A4E66_02359 [Syntrophus sp. PtaB.Bin001]